MFTVAAIAAAAESGEFLPVTDSLPERPACLRSLTHAEFQAYRAYLVRLVAASSVARRTRRKAAERLFDADARLYSATVANWVGRAA